MMKKLTTRLISAFLGTSVFATAAGAAPLTLTKDAATGIELVDARVKTDVLGKIKLNNGSVKIVKNEVSVGAVPEWLFDRHTVLTGKLVNHKIDSAAGKTVLTGLMYFLDGEWVSSLPDVRRRDTLHLVNGQAFAGRIRNFTADSLDFDLVIGQTRRFKLADIATIESPRAFSFTIPVDGMRVDPAGGTMLAEANQISFVPADRNIRQMIAYRKAEEPKSQLSGTEGGVPKYYVGSLVGLDMLNTFGPPIVAALVLPYSWQSARNTIRQADVNSQIQGNLPLIPFRGDVRQTLINAGLGQPGL